MATKHKAAAATTTVANTEPQVAQTSAASTGADTTTATDTTNTTQAAMPTVKNEKVITTVVMADGRIVEFPGTRQMQKALITRDNTSSGQPGVRFDFINGQSSYYYPNEAMQMRLALHGAMQKIGDAAAGLKLLGDMQLEIDKMINRLNDNEWEAERKEPAAAGGSLLLEAVLRAFPNQTREGVVKLLSIATPEKKKALKLNEKVAPHITAIEKERAAVAAAKNPKAAVAVDDLLGQLAGMETEPAA